METGQKESRQKDARQEERRQEEKYLQRTLAIAASQLKQARDMIEGKQQELIEAKKEARENAVHSVGNLYSSEEFEALAELSQYTNAVTMLVADCEEEERRIFRLENLLKTPYFARIDFLFEGEEQAEPVYIGRSSLIEKKTHEMVVYDWRSPIAGVFYRFMTGKAFYEAPGGRIEGEVTRKRQYEIANGRLDYFFDTDRNISDEILRQLLSQNTSPKMKAIVETIQKEQDIVIRDMGSDLLMVQGVAGSGKTSIALHRAAYLMYQGLQARLTADSILIVSPNAAFEQYISDVLPELGEENVASVVFEDILHAVLKERQIQPRHEFLEQAMTRNRYQKLVKSSMELKTSLRFRALLDRFLEDLPKRWLPFEDIWHEGACAVSAGQQREWVLRRPEIPLGIRLEQLVDFCLERIFGTARKRSDAEERNQIRQKMQKLTQLDVTSLYGRLFEEKLYFLLFTQDVEEPGEEHRIWRYTRENLETDRLFFDDAVAMAYLYLRIYGSSQYRNIRQVVIDEAQDYYPLQFEIFRMLFPNAKFTVLGDVNQTLAKQENLSFYDGISRILKRDNASLITLDKSFRCTNEILEFGLQFITRRPRIQSFNRSGEAPEVICADTRAKLFAGICAEVRACEEKGYKTICLLCKNTQNAQRLYQGLCAETELVLIQDNHAESLQGVFVMSIYQSKGLEFDAVILCDADALNYTDEDDRKLLYVASTRALHSLTVFGEGRISPLIGR